MSDSAGSGEFGAKVPIIFFGVDRFPALPLEKLLGNKYNVKAIFAAPDKDARNGKKIAPVAKVLGEKYGVPVFQPAKGREILPVLQALPGFSPELPFSGSKPGALAKPLGVLVSYGKIIPAAVLEWFTPMPIINIHPSLLPKYRGSSPVESAILNGDAETGVSIIKLVPEMDAGEVLAARTIEVAADETSSSLYNKAAETGWEMIKELIPKIAASVAKEGATSGTAQNHELATFTPRFEKKEAELTEAQTAAELERKVRAFDENPKAFFIHDGVRMKVDTGMISDVRHTPLDIHTADGKFYSPTVITPEGKRQMTTADYLRGVVRG
jgi:methionyl-tRNA formyltransferase